MSSTPAGYIVAVDQGTGSTKAVAVDAEGAIVLRRSVSLGQQHPHPGWVEQDAREILQSAVTVLEQLAAELDGPILGIGLSSQRESALVWDRATGEPLGPMLGWQDRRTAAEAIRLTEAGHADRVRRITGLPIDPMFSALKLAWLLDAVDPDRSLSRAGRIAAGTVDSWLLFSLTGEHRIELGNASRTQLLDLATGDWSPELLELFGIPVEVLPTVVASDAPSAPVSGVDGCAGATITAVLGDSHAALFAHGVRTPGAVKATYGTGSSILGLLAPEDSEAVGPGLVRTIAWGAPEPVPAFEGNILATGATLVWLGEVLGTTPSQLTALAEQAEADHGVNIVPAFAGLGAPWWDESAEGVITGFSLGTGQSELARAALESIALQVEDVLVAADAAGSARIGTILADGGPSSNDWLVQLQADLSQRTVSRSEVAELSALGAAHLAGRAVGLWTDDELAALPRERTDFLPSLDPEEAVARRTSWLGAVAKARSATLTEPSPHLAG